LAVPFLLPFLLAGAGVAHWHDLAFSAEGGALGAHAHVSAAAHPGQICHVEAGGESESTPCAACLAGFTKRCLPSPVAPVPQADSDPQPLLLEPGRTSSSPCVRLAGGRSPPPA